MHYKRWLKYGGPGPAGRIGKKASLEERFINRVRLGPGPCYIWTGCVHASGFGVLRTGHRTFYAHRLSWAMSFGPPPLGAKVVQTCHNKLCVRPDHLRLR
jgi:hypothetical protein